MTPHPSQVTTASAGPNSSAGDLRTEREASRAFPAGPWDPLMAWRLQSLYGPIAAALRSVMASRPAPSRPAAGVERRRLTVLQVGGHAEALASFLASYPTNGSSTDTFD